MTGPRDFSRITVVSVTGVAGPGGGEAAVPSLVHSASMLPGCRAMLISPTRPEGLPRHIAHQRIKPFGYIEYSLFILYGLQHFIETDFALVVQDDGWVLDAERWNDRFYQYDYIGAPSVNALVINRQGQQAVITQYEWVNLLSDPQFTVYPVYNGGFSLRSRRLLEAPGRLGLGMNVHYPLLSYKMATEPGHAGERVHELDWPYGQHAEDAQVCMLTRLALQNGGVRYAPLDLAMDFSFEYMGPIIHEGYRGLSDRARRHRPRLPPAGNARVHGQGVGLRNPHLNRRLAGDQTRRRHI